jgi:hypothetical protein
MKTKRSKFAAVVVIVLALLVSVTLIAGCVAIPTTTLTSELTSLSIHTPAPTEAPVPSPTTARSTPNPQPLPTNEQDCLKQGGTWGPQGRAQQNMCDLPTTDAGQPCTDSSQCEGACLGGETPSIGTCSPRRLNFGCYTVMKDGVQLGLCVD